MDLPGHPDEVSLRVPLSVQARDAEADMAGEGGVEDRRESAQSGAGHVHADLIGAACTVGVRSVLGLRYEVQVGKEGLHTRWQVREAEPHHRIAQGVRSIANARRDVRDHLDRLHHDGIVVEPAQAGANAREAHANPHHPAAERSYAHLETLVPDGLGKIRKVTQIVIQACQAALLNNTGNGGFGRIARGASVVAHACKSSVGCAMG